jgi:hypothetical protein
MGVGFMSISTTMRLLRDAQRWNKPVRILYASDFDPAGKSMPVTPARQIEFALRWKLGRRMDVRLDPVILT